jgi:hypothetical protein
MSNRIRYALGQSIHGDFIAALSDHGLVAFEFPVDPDAAVGGLLARFPDAILEEDAPGLATTLATLSRAVGNPAIGTSREASVEGTAPTLGIVASTNRLVRRNGSIAGGRACAASVRAASRHILPGIPKKS